MSGTEKTVRTVACPHCGKPVQWQAENKYRPFCSERCKQIDIGAWASESYRIAGPEIADESDFDVNSSAGKGQQS